MTTTNIKEQYTQTNIYKADTMQTQTQAQTINTNPNATIKLYIQTNQQPPTQSNLQINNQNQQATTHQNKSTYLTKQRKQKQIATN